MSRRLSDITLRRQALQIRIAAQRLEMAHLAERLQTPVLLGDHLLTAVHFIRAHPALLAVAAGLLAWRRPALSKLASTGLRLWKIYCMVRRQRAG